MTDNSKQALVSDAIAAKFATEKETPYTRWIAEEGLDIIDAMFVPDLHTVDLKPWARRGGRGVYLNHDASRTSNDCYVCEIPAGKELAPQRQLFEEMIYVLDGRGSTSVWNGAGAKVSFEWKAGAIFA
ncbi:MAG: ethanolamine ammonia lyase-activating protein, partial [Pseudomonadota bacterium]|nr:ethanolamine ammonia lyase-activating protein [Pseudomonadota bacterium]